MVEICLPDLQKTLVHEHFQPNLFDDLNALWKTVFKLWKELLLLLKHSLQKQISLKKIYFVNSVLSRHQLLALAGKRLRYFSCRNSSIWAVEIGGYTLTYAHNSGSFCTWS